MEYPTPPTPNDDRIYGSKGGLQTNKPRAALISGRL